MKHDVWLIVLACLFATGTLAVAQDGPVPITPDNADRLTWTTMIGRGTMKDMAWSVDGRTLAVATTLGVWLYDGANLDAEPIWVHTPSMWVNSLAFSPDGRWLAFDAGTNKIALCDPHTGDGLTVLSPETRLGQPHHLSWTDDGLLRVENDIGEVYTVDVEAGTATLEAEQVGQSESSPAMIQAASIDGTLAEGTLQDQRSAISILEPEATTIKELLGFHHGISSLAFSPDGATLIFGTGEGIIWWWDIDAGQYLRWTTTPTGAISTIAFNPDGTLVASAASQYPFFHPTISAAVRLYDTATGRLVQTLPFESTGLSTMAYSPDGTRIAASGGSSDFNTQIRLWTLGDDADTEPLILEGHNDTVRALVFTQSSSMGLFSGAEDGEVRLWDMAGIERVVFTEGDGPVWDLALSFDGRQLAEIHGDSVLLREVSSGEAIRMFELPERVVRSLNSVTFNPAGTLLAAGGTDHQIFLWDVATGEHLATLHCPSYHDVEDLAFSPDGTLLASAANDGAVWLWRIP